jgi:hypothetical protein
MPWVPFGNMAVTDAGKLRSWLGKNVGSSSGADEAA